ncbi:HAMP domain-containing sensor histidine kinase [Anaerosalibacter sp. Marseille-P3206]|uniref:HAMP domain-containing sensor histidine kinase n=1 Tax=Anaerosalibacter sp. Marseille-P3206 TaxID=1871005 RepID=UPI0013565025|nr:HAMP domain-containing sensor histidine kinase [Anaerosalibacter sp. Marseille-P3206]
MKSKSFKKQFVVTFIKILLLSFIFSFLSFFIWIRVFDHISYPANYYEKQIADIVESINENYDNVLDKSFENKMNEIIPHKGVLYQVLNKDGNIVYGTLNKKVIEDKKELVTNINSTKSFNRTSFARIIPILDKDDNIKGAVVLSYKLVSTQKTSNTVLFLLAKSMIFLPFIFIIMFTFIYAKKLSKEINKPVNILLNASEKIKNQDLDFTIEYNENNEFTKLCNAFEDMRVNLKDSLIKQWDLEEKRRENIANIAHDLKTPLTIVSTYSEALIDDTVKEEKFKDYIEVIKRNNERALILLEDMNKISNIENPNFILEPVEINIVKFLKLKEKDFKLLCEEKGINFKIDIIDSREKKFINKFDIKSIEEILDNCISNSIRYTEKGESIKLNILCNDEDIKFSIIDTGKGFSNEDLKNLFNKFYKGDKSRSFTTGHSGLGMYIAKTIVEKHGGNIKAYNNNPKGAIIEFNIKPKHDTIC